MLSFIKNLFGSKPSQVEAEVPYKVEVLPAGTEAVMATTEQRYVGESEQGSVYETVVVVPDAVAPAMTPIPLVVESPVAAPAKKPAKPKALPKIKVPKAPK
jgi:hypothetical protein